MSVWFSLLFLNKYLIKLKSMSGMSLCKFLGENLLDGISADEVVDDDASVGLDGARVVSLMFTTYGDVAEGSSAAVERFLGRCRFVDWFSVTNNCRFIGMLTSGMELADLCRVVCYVLFVLVTKENGSDRKIVELFTISNSSNGELDEFNVDVDFVDGDSPPLKVGYTFARFFMRWFPDVGEKDVFLCFVREFIRIWGKFIDFGDMFGACWFPKDSSEPSCVLFNRSGNVAADYDCVFCDNEFRDGFARIKNNEGRWNYVDRDGNLLFPDRWFEHCNPFSCGYGSVMTDNHLCRFVKTDGTLSERGFASCGIVVGNFVSVQFDKNKRTWTIIDLSGSKPDMDGFKILSDRFHDGFVVVEMEKDQQYQHAFMDESGKIRFGPRRQCNDFHCGFAIFYDGQDKYKYLAKDGRESRCFSKCHDFDGGYAVVENGDGGFNIIDGNFGLVFDKWIAGECENLGGGMFKVVRASKSDGQQKVNFLSAENGWMDTQLDFDNGVRFRFDGGILMASDGLCVDFGSEHEYAALV